MKKYLHNRYISLYLYIIKTIIMKQKFGIYIAGETQSWIMNDGKPGTWEAELDDIMEFASKEEAQTWLDNNDGGGGPDCSIIEIENIYEL